MRGFFGRYTQLTVPQKRLYSLLTIVTLFALVLYCLGIGSFLLRSRLVSEVTADLPPTLTASPTLMPTALATPRNTATPPATLPPTPTQRPIPTFTPTPESVNVTVVITTTDGLTTTTVISATVTPTPTFTPTVTITAEASLTLTSALELGPLSTHETGSAPESQTSYRAHLPLDWDQSSTTHVASAEPSPRNRDRGRFLLA
jgi:hypothetical protein